tara:strand:- start:42 stop:170 length:129 start_codon:yes stop_codon:yes gene_type:complete
MPIPINIKANGNVSIVLTTPSNGKGILSINFDNESIKLKNKK